MRRYSAKDSFSTLSEINVTPMLDLCFVLLVIFMVTTPLLENSIDLVVPTSATASKAVEPSQVQTISIDKNNVLKLNNDVVDPNNLSAALREIMEKKKGIAVVVRPHRELSVQKFVDVMDTLQKLKISKVGVVTQPDTPK
ncbi:MAG TPA: biopolymer transporter ExbD [Chthoniobacterales bacterium]|jgi:biopolymer transport protein ExbD